MSRRIRHIHARSNEWVRVHRNKRSDNGSSGWGCLVLIILLVLIFS